MNKLFSAALLAAFSFATLEAGAVPAKRGVRQYKQPDGSMVNVTLHGDENFHYYLTADNMPLMEDADGALYFATVENGKLQKTKYLACDASMRSTELKAAIAGTNTSDVVTALRAKALNTGRRNADSHVGLGKFTTTFPTKGEQKALVVLVEYKDVKFKIDDPKQYFTDMLNKDGFSEYGATGCARQYFLDASNGQFDLTCDVYGPVTLPNNRSYYGGNGLSGHDRQPEEMVIDAIKQLDPTVDFSQYDRDKDGILDNVFLFYAGKGEASGGSADTVWPHAWNLEQAGKSFTVDGVLVDHYACTCELQGTKPDGIGTFCHEFSHIMGLPDLYNTVSGGNYTPGEWSVMDYGPYNNDSRTPPTYSAYERNAMGWLDLQTISEATSVKLEDLKKSNKAAVIGTSRANEFFLFENRQQTSWDTYLPGHGMLIWHIDFVESVFDGNTVNNDPDHQFVDLVEANGAGKSAQGAAWPGALEKTEFTANTNPAFIDWYKKDPGLPITGIMESDGNIYFDVDGGNFVLPAPTELTGSEVTPISMQLSWQPVERAKEYTVSVYKTEGTEKKYVEGFESAKYPAKTTSVEISGLDAETEYTAEVTAISGTRISEPATVNVKTAVMTFPYMTPEVLPAADIDKSSFTACWKPVEGADHYLLTVEGAYEVAPKADVCDFGSLIFRVPIGWDYSLKVTRYTDPYWCGKASPSAKLDKDGATITTALYEHDVLSLSFWARLAAYKPESTIVIDGLINGEWTTIKKIKELSTDGKTYNVDNIPEGTRQIRFTYLQSDGANLAIDDIEIMVGGVERKTVEGFDAASIGNVTSYKIENLSTDETGYYYKVMAVAKDDSHTLWSAEQYVELGDPTSIGKLALTDGQVVISPNGILSCNGRCGETVKVYSIDGRTCSTAVIDNNGNATLPLNKPGIYVVRLSGRSIKILR